MYYLKIEKRIALNHCHYHLGKCKLGPGCFIDQKARSII